MKTVRRRSGGLRLLALLMSMLMLTSAFFIGIGANAAESSQVWGSDLNVISAEVTPLPETLRQNYKFDFVVKTGLDATKIKICYANDVIYTMSFLEDGEYVDSGSERTWTINMRVQFPRKCRTYKIYAGNEYYDFPCEASVIEGKIEDDPYVAVESVVLDSSSLSMKIGDTSTLTATVAPEKATYPNVTWSSSDNTVATVENGVVTGVAAGKATITATADGKSATCSVTVIDPSVSPTDSFYKVFHLDAGRKYFSLASLKRFVDMAVSTGYNQVNVYLSDNQGFRIKLDDMTVTTSAHTYDLTACVGDGYTEGAFMPCSVDGDDSAGYITQSQFKELVDYAAERGIEIVPTINTPAHMGAILQDLTYSDGTKVDLRADTWGSGLAAVKLTNAESMAFVTALTKKMVDAFSDMGCKYYCIGGDEYMSGYPTSGTGFDNFVTYVNEVADYMRSKGVTPRMFNDSFLSSSEWTRISKDYELYYWSNLGNRQDPQDIADAGYKLINTPENLYYVLRTGDSAWWLDNVTVDRIQAWDITKFSNSNGSWRGNWAYVQVTGESVSNIVGATLCVWCDSATAMTTDEILTDITPISEAFTAQTEVGRE